MKEARAGDVWVAAIEPKPSVAERARIVLIRVFGILTGTWWGSRSTQDAVIRRRHDGVEVLRGDAGFDGVWMLDQLERDLRSLSEESFAAKWRAGTDWTVALRNLG